jgi:hypothetical protein
MSHCCNSLAERDVAVCAGGDAVADALGGKSTPRGASSLAGTCDPLVCMAEAAMGNST